MKSTKIDVPDEDKYPCLMYDMIKVVLFVDHGCGTVAWIDSGSSFFVGEYRANWSMEGFEPFAGKITLENS